MNDTLPETMLAMLGKVRPQLVRHPLNDLPYQSDDEFRDLVRSIRKIGLTDPITMHEGKVLDGWNRYLACLVAGVEPRFEDFKGFDASEFVLARMTRRNMNESKRGLWAAKLMRSGRKADGTTYTNAEVRHAADVGETIVTQAVRVIANGVPELQRLIENGDVTVAQAARVCVLSKAEQKAMVKHGADSVKAKAAQIRKGEVAAKPAAVKSPAAKAADPEFSGLLGECVRDLTTLSAKITRLIQTSDGERFAEYVKTLGLGWIDHSGVKLADAGEGLKKHGPQFVALRQVRRLLSASFRHRHYPAAQLRQMLDDAGCGVLDADRPPADDTVPARSEELVEPESL